MFPKVTNETERLAALADLAITGTPREAHFDAVCRLARDLFDVPLALISIIEADHQWFKASCGMDLSGTARGASFCTHTILSDEILVVEDAVADPRFAAGPLVQGAPGIRFYAGAPLVLRPGICVGALCVKDTVPRSFSPEQARQLRDLAEIVVAHLRLHESKQAFETESLALRAAREAQRVAETAACFGHWRIDAGTREIAWSDGVAAVFGRPMPLSGRLDLDAYLMFYHPAERDASRRSIEEAIAGTNPATHDGYQVQRRIIRTDGEERVISVRCIPDRDASGAVRAIHGVLLDVTERSRAEARLCETTGLLRATLENMDQGLIYYGSDQRVRVHNQRAREILDLPQHVLHDGAYMADIHRFLVERDEFADSPDHLIHMVRSGVQTPVPNTFERIRPNGVVVEVHGIAMADGGVVWTFSDVTQRRVAEGSLRASEARYRLLAEHATDMIIRRSVANIRTYVSPSAQELIGYTPEELLTMPLSASVHPEDEEAIASLMRDLLAGKIDHGRISDRIRHKDGHWVWVDSRFRLVRDETGMPVEIITTVRDISERKAAEDALRESQERLALALDGGSDGLWDWNVATDALGFSSQYGRALGYAEREVEHTYAAWLQLVHPEDVDRTMRLVRTHFEGGSALFECEHRIRSKAGEYRWMLARGKAVARDEIGRALRMVGTFIDITSRKEAERQITHMAMHDALTGLPNRLLFRDRLMQVLADTRREAFAVLACDLDRFKEVNDALGHPAGDQLLRTIAERLARVVRVADTVARLGGDEFAIILDRLDSPKTASLIAQQIIEAVAWPVELGGHSVTIGVSIGIALGTAECRDADGLFKNADIALYRAKTNGRNTYSFYEPGMDAAVAERNRLEGDLRLAVREGAFTLHYQPIVRLEDNELGGFEALMRWSHGIRGMVSPAEFIPLAEETGLIVLLGEWALREACREAAGWPKALRVAVNVSAVQFRRPGLEQAVVGALAASGLSPKRLELEITESVLMEDSETAIACLHRLRRLGVRIALDDFGTGYSSLSYLRLFPFDKIKIDRSFVRDIADPDAAAIVRAVIGIGTRLGATITAEGIETSQQLECVREMGCAEVQGFLLGRPSSSAEALLYVKEHNGQAVA